MSKPVNVLAISNIENDLKPCRYTLDGKTYKVDEVVSKFETPYMIVFHCLVNRTFNTLILDIATNQWTIETAY